MFPVRNLRMLCPKCSDAQECLKDLKRVPRHVKPLGSLLQEYIQLKEADVRRQALVARNPPLRDILNVINARAGITNGAQPVLACNLWYIPALSLSLSVSLSLSLSGPPPVGHSCVCRRSHAFSRVGAATSS
jgi:hypothetical protein